MSVFNLNKKLVSKEGLLRYITDYQIYAEYIDQEIIVGKNIYSPFRKELNPSFGFFMGENNEICFHDFTLRLKGDCIKFVMILFDLNYFEALSRIAIDFNMQDDFICAKNLKKSKTVNNDFQINTSREKALARTLYKFTLGKKRRSWEPKDLIFWKDFGISIKTLKKYRVEPISHIIINGRPIKADEYAYVFIETKDNVETYKIYQPFSKDYKWLNSHNESIWQGWSQLPESSDPGILIITKSLKDVMAITENTQFSAVALQCENVLPKKHVIEELKERFGRIVIFYDNDYDKEENWGQLFANNLQNETGFENIFIDEKFKSKDFSDLIKNNNVEKAVDILETELNVPF